MSMKPRMSAHFTEPVNGVPLGKSMLSQGKLFCLLFGGFFPSPTLCIPYWAELPRWNGECLARPYHLTYWFAYRDAKTVVEET